MAENDELITSVIGENVIPQIEAVTDAIVKLDGAFMGFATNVKANRILIEQATNYMNFAKAAQGAQEAQESMNSTIRDAESEQTKFKTIIVGTNQSITQYARQLLEAKMQMASNNKELKALYELMAVTSTATNIGRQAIEKYNTRINELVGSNVKLSQSIAQLNGIIKENAVAVAGTNTAFTNFESILNRSLLRAGASLIIWQGLGSIIEWIGKKFEDAKDGVTDWYNEILKATEAVDKFKKRKDGFDKDIRSTFGATPIQTDQLDEMDRQLKLLQAQQETGRNALKDKEKNLALDKEIYELQKKKGALELTILKENQFEADHYRAHGDVAGQARAKEISDGLDKQIKDKVNELKIIDAKFERQQEDKYNPYKKPKKTTSEYYNLQQFGREVKSMDRGSESQSDEVAREHKFVQDRMKDLKQLADYDKEQGDIQKAALVKRLSDGKLTLQQYSEEVKKLDDGTNKHLIANQIEQLKKWIDNTNLYPDVKEQMLDKLYELEKKAADAEIKLAEETAKEKAKREEQFKQQAIDTAEGMYAAIKQIQDNQLAQEQTNLERKLQMVQLQEQQEIDSVNATIGNTVDKQQKLNTINAQGQSQENSIAAQEKDLAIKKAKGDKTAAEAGVVEKTAEGVAALLPYYATNPVFAAAMTTLVLSLGAAQFAAAASAPIPTYAHEGVHPKDGPAIFGDNGPEYANLPGGNKLYADKPTLINAPKGTDFKLAKNQMREYMENGINPNHMAEAMTMQLVLEGALKEQTKELKNGFEMVVYATMRKQPINFYGISKGDAQERQRRSGH